MQKTILITGATDGIGLETAKMMVSKGHFVLIHGRSQEKLTKVEERLSDLPGEGKVESFIADLSKLLDVVTLTKSIKDRVSKLDAIINNAGVFKTSNPVSTDGLDVRFVVNTIAPFLLTQQLLPLVTSNGRIVNVSSAAQAPVNPEAIVSPPMLSDSAAYAQSKLALTMWSRHLAQSIGNEGPVVVAVNPASMLGSKMVKEAFGVNGGDLRIGADILCRAALSDEFASSSGQYYDNDSRQFASPHPDALDPQKYEQVVEMIKKVLEQKL